MHPSIEHLIKDTQTSIDMIQSWQKTLKENSPIDDNALFKIIELKDRAAAYLTWLISIATANTRDLDQAQLNMIDDIEHFNKTNRHFAIKVKLEKA